MNLWIIAAVITGLLVIAGVFLVSAGIDKQEAGQTAKTLCLSCGGSCTAEKNCGLPTCGAVAGGSCGCRK